jgi:hypothetical protein
MANVTAEFTGDYKTFLSKKIVFVPEPVDKATGPRSFWFSEEGGFVTLKAGSPPTDGVDKSSMSAYWLSWETGKIAAFDLGGGADFFFTSQMTNCTFKVLTKSTTAPKVAHIAGTMGSSDQVKAEKELLKDTAKTDVSGPLGSVLKAGHPKHEYTGQSGKDKDGRPDPGSAFVFGIKDSSGNWKFAAQIVKANLADERSFALSLKSGVPRIADLFEFK